STLGNEAEPDKDNFLEEVLEKEIELGKDNFSEKVLENEVELGEDNFSEVLENESNNLPSDWREVLDNSDDSDIEWETQEIILVTYDECIFYSNDGKRGVWAKSVQIPSNPYVPEESRVILKPGKNYEGYWANDHLIEQVEFKAIPIFEALFPNCTALFAFDNSTNHGSYKPDALVASRVNLNPGGKQPKMKDTVFEPNNIFQSMVFEDGIPKGMKQVLVEKNLRKE
ncbi:20269_t:CDS:2, partial [Entrophospora sp. SA101]